MWARPPGDSRWHYVVDENGASVKTKCLGRWPATMLDVERADVPPIHERCGGCLKLLVNATPAVDFAFDMSEEDYQ